MDMNDLDAVFLDIDGTLYDHQAGCVPPAHTEAVKALAAKGIRVCLCSGRCLPLLEDLGILDLFAWDGIVAGNGAYVYDKDGTLVFSQPFSKEDSQRLFSLARQRHIPVFAAGSCALVTFMNKDVEDLFEKVSIHDVPVRDPEPEDTFAVVSLVTTQPVDDFETESVKLLGNALSPDLMPRRLSKLVGIRKLMDHWGLHTFAAFGDNMNDYEMLVGADLGVAMGNSQPELLRRIPEHCPSVQEGGIAVWLKEHGII